MIYTSIVHSRRMRKIDQWGKFNREIIDLVDEISDNSIRVEFIEYCTKIATRSSSEIYNFSEKDERKRLVNIFGKYIPSIIVEQRDDKIKKILS